jgi:hypothetical protein
MEPFPEILREPDKDVGALNFVHDPFVLLLFWIGTETNLNIIITI